MSSVAGGVGGGIGSARVIVCGIVVVSLIVVIGGILGVALRATVAHGGRKRERGGGVGMLGVAKRGNVGLIFGAEERVGVEKDN